MTEAEGGYGEEFGATSLNDLRRINANPFSWWGRIKNWFLEDEFRGICGGVTIGTLILTIALIIDVAVGKSAVSPMMVIVTSNPLCTKLGQDHLSRTRNSFDASILSSMCLLAAAPSDVSLFGGGVAAVHKINSNEQPTFINFTFNPDSFESNFYSSFMKGMLELKSLSNEVESTYTNQPIIQTALPDLISKVQIFIKDNFPSYVDELGPYLLEHLDFIRRQSQLQEDARHVQRLPVNTTDHTIVIEKDGLDGQKEEINSIVSIYTSETSSIVREALSILLTQTSDNIDDIKLEECIAETLVMISNTTENFELDELQLGCFPEGQVFREVLFPEYYNTSTVTVLGDDLRMISLSFTMGMSRKCSEYQDPGIDLSTIRMCTPTFSPDMLFPMPLIVKRVNETCGSCGHHTAIMGDIRSIIHLGGRVIKKKQINSNFPTGARTLESHSETYHAAVEFVVSNGQEQVDSTFVSV